MALKELRLKLGVTQPIMARLLNISVRQVSALETEAETPSLQMTRNIREMQLLYEGLGEVTDVDPKFLARWLVTRNESLGNFSPIELIERGEIGELYRLIYFLGSGMPT